jgi:hypothetical protein
MYFESEMEAYKQAVIENENSLNDCFVRMISPERQDFAKKVLLVEWEIVLEEIKHKEEKLLALRNRAEHYENAFKSFDMEE